tara:strand:- start:2382 stop:3074 length:693 start_codon:yes stop_codon:yes gene_type:complete
MRNAPHLPEPGRGASSYVAKKLGVSNEAVRKWVEGETQPRAHYVRNLADLLKVDYVWLSIGELDDSAKMLRNAVGIKAPHVLAFFAWSAMKNMVVAWDEKTRGKWIIVKEGLAYQINLTPVTLELNEDGTSAYGVFHGEQHHECHQILAIQHAQNGCHFDFIYIPGIEGKTEVSFRNGKIFINDEVKDAAGNEKFQEPTLKRMREKINYELAQAEWDFPASLKSSKARSA